MFNENGDTSWIGHLGNALHFQTREWVVKNHLLFSENDTASVDIIEESERLLRESGFLTDARIVAAANSDDEITLDVITKDKWTINLLASYEANSKSGYLGLNDDNIAGLGHMFEGTLTHDQNPAIGLGAKFKYTARNIAGTYFNVSGNYEVNNNISYKSISVNRDFFSIFTEWAGGLDIISNRESIEVPDSSGQIKFHNYSRQQYDLWFGHAFPIWFGSHLLKQKTKIILAIRGAKTSYSRYESIPFENLSLFNDRAIYLAQTGINNQRFYKDFYVDGFGRTEDILVGGLFSVTSGFEYNAGSDNFYLGANINYSRRFEELGYMSASLEAGGFKVSSNWRRKAVSLLHLYHSPLLKLNLWKMRIFSQINFITGIDRDEGEIVLLDQENGLRGIVGSSASGTKRLVINLEARLFSPFKVFGFVLGGIAFSDFGVINQNREEPFFSNNIYRSYGIGFRTANESIANTSFTVSAAYIPLLPDGRKNDFAILFTGSVLIGWKNFNFSKPDIIKFGNRY